MKFDTIKKKTAFLLVISLILMLLCGIVVSAVQTKGGKVSMKEMTIETDSGYAMSAILFVPDTATKENPAPAIVVSHGYLNNKEMTDANFVELARRGYVVLTVDQPNHGNSEVVEDVNSVYFDGIYQGVLAVSRMPFVDTTKIGVTGHSMGAYSCNAAVMADNAADTQLISAVLLNCNDPLATDGDGNYLNLYGSRDVGIISVVYDEFFGKSIAEDGSVLQSPYWLESDAAQSFLNFGKDPSDCESREAYTEYYEGVDGTDAFHVIYRPSITHPWSHFSKKSVSCVVGFFEDSLGAPNPIGSSNQIWQVKEAFNAVGLIGFVLFICSFGGMLLYTRTFESLRPKEELLIPGKPVEGKASTAWFWLSLVAGVIFGSITYLPVMAKGTSLKTAQIMSMGIGLWAVICAAYSVGFMLIYYYTFGKKHGMDPKEVGIRVPMKKFWPGLLFAAIVIVVSYGCVFAENYFFKADFRIWTLGFKAFDASLLKYLPYVVLFLIYYIVLSLAINCFYFNTVCGKFNTVILALFTAAPAVILSLIHNIVYFTQKHMPWPDQPLHIISLYQIMSILFVAVLVNRFYYRRTKNPYIAGVITGVIVAVFTITNTCSLVV